MDKKANRQRNIGKYFCVSELENQIIEKRMQEANLINFGDFVRKSCLDKKFGSVAKLKNNAFSEPSDSLLSGYS